MDDQTLEHRPPLMPYVEAMPRVIAMLKDPRQFFGQEADFLHTQCGGNPHYTVRKMWLKWLLGMPMHIFRGDPIWYRYIGNEPTNGDNLLSLDGGPLRRDLMPGEVFRFKGWKYENNPRFERIERGVFTTETPEGGETTTEDVSKREHPPWEEIRQMGFNKARAFLAKFDIRGKSWDDLAIEYEAFLLSE